MPTTVREESGGCSCDGCRSCSGPAHPPGYTASRLRTVGSELDSTLMESIWEGEIPLVYRKRNRKYLAVLGISKSNRRDHGMNGYQNNHILQNIGYSTIQFSAQDAAAPAYQARFWRQSEQCALCQPGQKGLRR